jgi:hypothetical protein
VEHVVERHDLWPIGGVRRLRLGVHRGDGGLDRVRTEPARGERGFDERHPLGDAVAVPQRAILVFEEHDVAGGRSARGAARILQQQEREEPDRPPARQELDQQARDPDRFAAEIVPASAPHPTTRSSPR